MFFHVISMKELFIDHSCFLSFGCRFLLIVWQYQIKLFPVKDLQKELLLSSFLRSSWLIFVWNDCLNLTKKAYWSSEFLSMQLLVIWNWYFHAVLVDLSSKFYWSFPKCSVGHYKEGQMNQSFELMKYLARILDLLQKLKISLKIGWMKGNLKYSMNLLA